MTEGSQDQRLAQWGTLAAGLAHEVNNPLSTMSIGLELLKEDLQGRSQVSSGQILPRIDLLLREVTHLQRIVTDFLRLAREPELDLRERDPNTLIEEVIDLFQPELRQGRVHVSTQLDRSTRPLRLDPDLLRQVLVNLIRNAIQAMPDGGTLTVLSRSQEKDFRIEVIDTGSGIPIAIQPRIFDGFFSTRPGGTGIGLAIARQIIERHQGTIECQSAPGMGTRFVVAIPKTGAGTA